MNRLALTALVLVASASAVAAQELTFTTLGTETTRSGSSGTSLATISPEDVAVVTPYLPIFYSAETYADHLNWNTLAGDGDGDGDYYGNPLAGHIDALQICETIASYHTMRDLFFSTKLPVQAAGGGYAGGLVEPGDVSAIETGAVRENLIDDVQIRSALGIPTTVISFDVDAILRHGSGTIFLSFEEDMPILGGTDSIKDGSVVAILGSAINYGVCGVDSVVANSAIVAIPEWKVNQMVLNASVADNAGALVTTIDDLDGLEADPMGGTFLRFDGLISFPNLIFCGERLTGGGILSTRSGGSIAQINVTPMAKPFGFGATDGTQVGLHPSGSVGSLDGLALADPTCRFILDSTTPKPVSFGSINFTAGGADPGQPVFFFATVFGNNTPGGYQPSVSAINPCFPDWYFGNVNLFGGPADALGFVDITMTVGAIPVGETVVLQGLTPKSSAWSLSAPITLQL